MKVADILAANGGSVQTIRRDDTIGTLSSRLQKARIGAMIVSDDGETLDGIISERDIAYGLAARRGDLHLVKVSILMTKDVITCTPQTTAQEAALLMSHGHVRHLAVVNDDKVVGVISLRDVIGLRLGALEHRTDILKKLIAMN